MGDSISPVNSIADTPFRDGSWRQNLGYNVTGGGYASTAGSGAMVGLDAFDKRGGVGVSLRYSSVGTSAGLTPSTVTGPYNGPGAIGFSTTDITGSVANTQSKVMLMGTYNHPIALNDKWTLRVTSGAGLGSISNSATAKMSYHSSNQYVSGGKQYNTVTDSSSNIGLNSSSLAAGVMAEARWEYKNQFSVGVGIDYTHGFGSSTPSSAGAAPAEALTKIPGMDPVGISFSVGYRF